MKTPTHIARVQCLKCMEIITSEHGGNCVSCSCGSTMIDQERLSGHYVRILGKEEDYMFLGQTCPATCEKKNHKDNKKV